MLALALAGDTARAQSLAEDWGKRFPLDTPMQSLWLPAIRAQVALDPKNPDSALNTLQNASPIVCWNISFIDNYFLPVSDVRAWRGIPGRPIGQRCRRRVSENSRSQRYRLELLDGRAGPSGTGPRQRIAVEALAGSALSQQGEDQGASRLYFFRTSRNRS